MAEWLKLLLYALRSLFKSRARLEAENLVLRQQLNILLRSLPYGQNINHIIAVPKKTPVWSKASNG